MPKAPDFNLSPKEFPMDFALTTATWLWLFVPMPLVVIISLVSWLRHTRRGVGR